jgi:MYXO-CTERM domain-containing protein
VQVDEMGFRPPLLPDLADGPEFDVYLAPIGFGYAYVTADQWPYVDPVLGDDFNGASSYMVVDQNLSDVWIPSYMAHEFQHVTQYATDYSEFTLPIWESVAVAAQQWTLGWPDSDWDYDVRGFQNVPWAPTVLADQYMLPYPDAYNFEYGGGLWAIHLDRWYGNDDGQLGVALWLNAAQEGYPNEPDVVDALEATAGTTLAGFLNTLAVQRWLVGPNWDERGLVEAEAWAVQDVPPSDAIDAPALPIDWTPTLAPMIAGQAFLEVTGLTGLDPAMNLRVSASSATGYRSGVMVLTWDAAGNSSMWMSDGIDPSVEFPAADLGHVLVAVSNAGLPDFDADETNPMVPGDQIVTLSLVEPPVTTTPGTTTPGTTPPTGGTGGSGGTGGTSGTGGTGGTGGATDPGPDGNGGAGLIDEDPSCGCASGPTGAPWPALLLALAARRRRSP